MREILNWNEGWLFAKCERAAVDPAAPVSGEGVTLPHTWYADGDYYQGDAVYQKRFSLPLREGRHAFLRFDGVDKTCEVFLNSARVGAHEGGYTRFAVELTEALREGENLLTVFVNNAKGETVSPLSGDFTIFGGLYRKVELLVTEEAYFDPCFFGTEGVLFRSAVSDGVGSVAAEPHLGGALSDALHLRYTLRAPSGELAAQAETGINETAALSVADPVLWNGKKAPALYEARAELFRGETCLDSVSLRLGFRSFCVDADKGFFLNGEHLKLHGVAKHQDTAGVFSAAGEADWQKDFALLEEIGANTVRLSHYPHAHRVYELCDEAGLVVWAEIPLLKLTMNDALLENNKQQLTEMIYQNLHHPSICFWGIQNEIAIFGEKPYMVERLGILNDLAHRLDPSRLTTSANLNSVLSDSPLNRITDVQAYNIYYGWYYGEMSDHAAFLDEFHRVNPTVPLGISEYGVDCNPRFHSAEPKVNDYSEEYQALYHETVYPYMAQRDFVWGSYIWNMFDFVSAIRNAGGVFARNIKGLVSFDRETKKDSFYYYKAQWSEKPFIHIAEKRFINRAAETMTLKVYSNLPELTLSFAGQSMSCRSDTGVFRFEGCPLSENGTEYAVTGGACEDRAVFCRVAEPDESYVFVDTNVGINVRNWFVDEAEEARLFPEDAYSLRDTMEDLLAVPEIMAVIDRMTPDIGKLMRDGIPTYSLEATIRFAKPDYTEDEIKALNEALIRFPKA